MNETNKTRDDINQAILRSWDNAWAKVRQREVEMNSTNTTLEELKNMTRDELSDAIRAHINKIVPRPLGGFASSGEEAAHIARREDQWIWINRLPRATIINTILGY